MKYRNNWRILVVAALALASCTPQEGTVAQETECAGGEPTVDLVYDSTNEMVVPGKDVAVNVGWGRTPTLNVGDGYLELHFETHTGHQYWTKLDYPLTPGVWVPGQYSSNFYRAWVALGWGQHSIGIEQEWGGQPVSDTEYCQESDGTLFSRPLKER